MTSRKMVALQVIHELPGRDRSREPLFYNEFSGSSVNFTLRFWISFAKQTDFLAAQSRGIIALKKAFDEAGITIPFPVRTLDFGEVGGLPLAEALPQAWVQHAGQA